MKTRAAAERCTICFVASVPLTKLCLRFTSPLRTQSMSFSNDCVNRVSNGVGLAKACKTER